MFFFQLQQAFNKNKPSTNGGDKEEERADSCNNDEEITQKEKNSSESSGKLKRTSVSISLSSLSSGIDEFNQSQNKQVRKIIIKHIATTKILLFLLYF